MAWSSARERSRWRVMARRWWMIVRVMVLVALALFKGTLIGRLRRVSPLVERAGAVILIGVGSPWSPTGYHSCAERASACAGCRGWAWLPAGCGPWLAVLPAATCWWSSSAKEAG